MLLASRPTPPQTLLVICIPRQYSPSVCLRLALSSVRSAIFVFANGQDATVRRRNYASTAATPGLPDEEVRQYGITGNVRRMAAPTAWWQVCLAEALLPQLVLFCCIVTSPSHHPLSFVCVQSQPLLSVFSCTLRLPVPATVRGAGMSPQRDLFIAAVLLAVGLYTRLWDIADPRTQVFDETHFTKFSTW